MSQKKLSVGILGAGFMGGVHCRSLGKLEGIEIKAVCAATMDESKSLIDGNKLFSARAYADFDAMLSSGPLDVLYVCIPPFAHDGQVVKAARKGIHLFLEKPIALNVKDAEAMVAAIAEAGVVSQVGFHMRFRKSVKLFKKMIDAGELGRPTLFSGRFWCNMDGSAWWRDRRKSGGQIYEQAIHLYDLASYLLGTPTSASGLLSSLCHAGTPGYTIEDTGVGMVQFSNGAMAAITNSNCALKDHFIGDFRVVFEKGVFDYGSTGDWRIKDEAVIHCDGKETKVVEDGDAYFEETVDFINAIRNAGKTVTPVCHGLDAIKLVSAVMDSAQLKKIIQL